MSYIESSYTADDVVSHVKRQFGDEAAIQITDADIIRWANSGQREIFRISEPTKSSTTADLVAGQNEYSFPDNVLRVQSIYVNGIPVPQRSVQEAEDYVLGQNGNQTGTPIMWWEWAGTFKFYPTPDTNLTSGIKFNYIKNPTKLVNKTDALSVPDVYFNRLIEYVLQQAYELDENFAASSMKGSQFAENLATYGNKDQIKDNTYPTITILEEDYL